MLAALPAWSQPVDVLPLPGTLAQALERVNQVVRWTGGPNSADDLARCRAMLEPFRAEAMRAEARGNFGSPFYQTAMWLSLCTFAQSAEGGPAPTEAQVHAWFTPWAAEHLRQSAADPLANIKWEVMVEGSLRAIGLVTELNKARIERTKTRITRLQAVPDDPRVNAELYWYVGTFFGKWHHQVEARELHALLVRGLGPGHRTAVMLLRTLAYHERFLGRGQQALTDIERAVELTRHFHAQDALLNAHMATEHAACLSANGRLAEARQRLLQAWPAFVAQVPPSITNLFRTQNLLAETSLAMGDWQGTVGYADAAIKIAQASADVNLLAEAKLTQATRALARVQIGDIQAAQDLRRWLESASPGEMHAGGHATALVEFALQNDDQELFDWASGFAQSHIRNFRSPMQSDTALMPLMQAWRIAGLPLVQPAVRPHLDQALAIALTRRSLGTLALTQFSMARHRATSIDADAQTAIWLYKDGANALQKLRQGLPNDQPELHRAWLGNYERDLRGLIGLLIDEGRLVEAEQAIWLLRDEESFEFSRRSGRPRASGVKGISYTPTEALRNEQLQAASAIALGIAERADLRLDTRNEHEFRTHYVDPVAQAELTELTAFVHRIVEEAPATRAFAAPPALIAKALPKGTARLTYFMRDQGVDLVLQTGAHLVKTTSGLTRLEASRLVQAARRSLGSPQADPMPALQVLYDQLLKPVRPWLERSHVARLEIAPDAVLRYLPFGALHDGRQFVTERFVVTTRWAHPSQGEAESGKSSAKAAPPARRSGVLALGRTQGDAEHGALPGVAQELATVPGRNSRVWLDAGFTQQRLQEGLSHNPSVVHLASHFVLDPGGEEKSYLLLGDGQRLALSTLADMPWKGVPLALLSACETGVALESGSGQALAGFAATLQRAGVANVLATLWRVSDGATARWMAMFYAAAQDKTRRGELARPDARQLALAQRQWLRQFAGTPQNHPHYWGGFTWLAGD